MSALLPVTQVYARGLQWEIVQLESAADPARAFSFAATSLWRNTYSPNTALGPIARKALNEDLPKPVIDLPVAEETKQQTHEDLPLFSGINS